MDVLLVRRLARPATCCLISFLAYGSQVFLSHSALFHLNSEQAYAFNTLVLCIWICYWRACYTNPGGVPLDWTPEVAAAIADGNEDSQVKQQRQRWCKKCEHFKPPRAHHCKICKRCIPKMDHHCPWTSNCVSYTTFPHFVRFLFYALASMSYLQYFLFSLATEIWNKRDLPSYLGPSVTVLIWLCVFLLVNSVTLFALTILVISSIKSLCVNVTTIESWEIERHHTLARRARAFGGFLDGPDGIQVKIVKQEFPYDVGIWSNIKQGMGGGILTWFWPLSTTPSASNGFAFEVNGFEDSSTVWPPPDPDRIPRKSVPAAQNQAFTQEQSSISDADRIKEFRERQEQDLKRQQGEGRMYRRKAFHQRFDNVESIHSRHEAAAPLETESGEEAWRNSEGERLDDFGVDEDVEFYDEDSVPLSKLLQRKRAAQSALSS